MSCALVKYPGTDRNKGGKQKKDQDKKKNKLQRLKEKKASKHTNNDDVKSLKQINMIIYVFSESFPKICGGAGNMCNYIF